MIDFEVFKNEYQEILQQISLLTKDADPDKIEELSKRSSFLEDIIKKGEELRAIEKEIGENKAIIASPDDFELSSLAEEELKSLVERQKKLESEIKRILKEDTEDLGPNSLIMEIRAGTGGDEASLFAANLYKMYSRYAMGQGWKMSVLDSHGTELGGYKEIIFELSGKKSWFNLKYEGGVHRIQRIPSTEKNGRIHTSTASVAVLAKPDKSQILVKPNDLKIDTYKASGAGGQYVQKTESAVRITHLPSGIVVTSQTERNQLQNKKNAMKILEARILEKREIDEGEKTAGARKSQIKWAKRAEKIRTYNIPQDRVTDHRIQKSWHNIEGIFSGKLEPIVEALVKIQKED
ncbi:MAG: peptide chain release factor 1 [Candidatus Parcubacteria bacterium]|nr:peptide chain release factor 1 [Candidatus Parcubacteria bacterium]